MQDPGGWRTRKTKARRGRGTTIRGRRRILFDTSELVYLWRISYSCKREGREGVAVNVSILGFGDVKGVGNGNVLDSDDIRLADRPQKISTSAERPEKREDRSVQADDATVGEYARDRLAQPGLGQGLQHRRVDG